MIQLSEVWEAIGTFLETGGNVLYVIFGVTALMWTLILERDLYFNRGHRREVERVVGIWRARSEHDSWNARQIRKLLISQVTNKLEYSLSMIKALVALCPLLGLLGTVTGMIEIFDVMAIAGSGNTRAMAAGVSKATIPTMAGMVAALSGLYFTTRLERFARNEAEELADRLTHA